MRYKSGLLAALLMCFLAVNASAQQRRILTGRITDAASGKPVGGAQIVIRGTNTGTLGRADGTFTISVPNAPVTLFVTFIGFKRAEVPVSPTQTTVTIPLTTDVLNVDEIVVTGQATGIARRNLANAVAKVNAEELVKAPTASVETALQGKLAGAQISQNNGAPGGGVNVRLRGTTTIIGSYTPLYVVDGVVVSDASIFGGTNFLKKADTSSGISGVSDNPVNRIADLNPNDIESIEVLKGAAAAAIYGSKASNGVIMITTKRGKAGAPQFSFSQKMGASEATKYFGARQFNSAAEAIAAFGASAGPIWQATGGQNFNAEKSLIGNKPLSYESSANVSGGSDNTRYFASGLVKHDGGVVTNTYANKQSLRVNLDQTLGTRMNIGISSEVIHADNDRGLFGNENNGTASYSALAYSPDFVDLRQRADGTWPVNPFLSNNVLQTAAEFKNHEAVWRSIFNLKGDFLAFNNNTNSLRFIMTGGGDVFTQKNEIFSPPDLYWEGDDGLPGTSIQSFSQSQAFNINANAVYKYQGAKLTATSQFGGQFESSDQNIARSMAQNLIGGVDNLRSGTNFLVEQDRQKVKDMGVFGQEEVLTLNEKLLLTLGLRADESSNNGDPSKLYYYPKAAASYRIPWKTGFTDELKLRGAVGQSGNRPQYGQKFTELQIGNVNGVGDARITATTGDNSLHPERQREIEGGFDLQFANSRGNLEVTGYEKRVSELLLTRTLAPTTGFATQYFNGGGLRTRGLEVALTFVPIHKTNFNWTARGTISGNRCIITDLPVPAFRPIAFLNGNTFGSTFIEPGKSCTQLQGFLPQPDGSRLVGTFGDANAQYRWSLSNDFTFKKIHFYALLDRQVGGLLLNGTQLLYDLSGTARDQVVELVPGYRTGNERAAEFGVKTSGYYESTTYLKLREASIQWELPVSVARKIVGNARYIRFGVVGRNLFDITKYRGSDPEGTETSRSAAAGVPWELGEYPPSRSLWFSVDLGL